MILKGSERGGAKNLAVHLLNDKDNDHIEIHKISGFMANDVEGALAEIYATSRATQCSNFMFSLSLSPPKGEIVSVEDFDNAVKQAAAKLGLSNQPHVVLFHEKYGRRHCHAVFSRIDCDLMKGINLSYYKKLLYELSHELFLTHGWEVPTGYKNHKLSNKLNYGLDEYQTAKRAKRDPQQLKSILIDCWEQSDSKNSFEAAIKEHGFYLCKGSRRGLVLVDVQGNVYSLSRWINTKSKHLKVRLGEPDLLPTVETVLDKIRKNLGKHALDSLAKINLDYAEKLKSLNHQVKRLVESQREERLELNFQHIQQKQAFAKERRKTEKPLKSLWNWVNGNRKAIIESIKLEVEAVETQHNLKNLQLISTHLQERQKLQTKIDLLNDKREETLSDEMKNTTLPLSKQVHKNPELILQLITEHQSVFKHSDITKVLDKYFDDILMQEQALAKILNSNELVFLQYSKKDNKTQYYSTRELFQLEHDIQNTVLKMSKSKTHRVNPWHTQAAINKQNRKLNKKIGENLSVEQCEAIRHITKDEQISCVVGYAGSGKSTMLSAAREAFEKQGYNVIGATLAGKAAEGLQQSSGIKSRTLASLELSWKNGYSELSKNDVLIIDEAGMIGSQQLSNFIMKIKNTGAKIILVGDPEQLQPINAGTPFKDIVARIGHVELTEIRRQKENWQREATRDLAQGRIADALNAYDKNGAVHFSDEKQQAISNLATDYLKDMITNGETKSRIALAHELVDVKSLNQHIRQLRIEMGELQDNQEIKTANDKQEFAVDDRILFTQNDKILGVKNGTLGTIRKLKGNKLTVQIDGRKSHITFLTKNYNALEYGYATSIHKSQGATVENAFVLASKNMDSHLTYVGLSRHSENINLYAGKDDFKNLNSLSRKLGLQREIRCIFDIKYNPTRINAKHNILVKYEFSS